MIAPADILKGKILIVDDKEVNILLLGRALRGAGYLSVESTMDSSEVCAMHRKNAYDLIILDLVMPVIDGFRVMEDLKKIETEDYLPVLAVTAHPSHKLRALEGGANDFISKPYDLAEVLVRVRNLIEVRLLHEAVRDHAKTLESLAMKDALTGLANRRLLIDRLSMALAHARRDKSAMAVVCLDLDGFKQINDRLGHAAGDILLKMVAARLSASVREEDTAARTGGDEFIISLWRIHDAAHAASVAAKLIDAVSRPYDVEGASVAITASAGVAIYPANGEDADALIRNADAALYEAKRAGKNGHRLAHGASSSAAPRRPLDPPASGGGTVRFELAPRTLATMVAAAGGLWLAYRLWVVLLLMVVALIFAGALNPIVEFWEARGHKRLNALMLVIFALCLGATIVGFLAVPSLIDQLTGFIRDLPGQREALIALLGRHGLTAPLGQALSAVRLDETSARLETYLIGRSSDALRVAGYSVTTMFLTLYFLADGKRMQGALYALVPRDYHMRLARIVHKLGKIVGGYMRGEIITSVCLSSFTFILLAACGVRNALSLSLLASLLDIIPIGGGLLAIVPAVLTALARGPQIALIVLAGMCAYQVFEDKILAPKIYWHTLRLSPAAVILALIAGGILLGMLGALLALPIAAGLQMIVEELGVSMPGDDSDDPEARARDEKTEAAYELMSSGSTAHDAGQIASGLAQDIRDADAWVTASRKKSPIS